MFSSQCLKEPGSQQASRVSTGGLDLLNTVPSAKSEPAQKIIEITTPLLGPVRVQTFPRLLPLPIQTPSCEQASQMVLLSADGLLAPGLPSLPSLFTSRATNPAQALSPLEQPPGCPKGSLGFYFLSPTHLSFCNQHSLLNRNLTETSFRNKKEQATDSCYHMTSLKNIMLSERSWRQLYDSLYLKCLEIGNIERQKAESWLPRAVGGMVIEYKRTRGTLWGDRNLLKLDYGDGCTTL